MSLDLDSILPAMITAARIPLNEAWRTVGPFAEIQLANIATRIESLGEEVALGEIEPSDALILLDIEKQAAISLLAALEGIGKVTAETAINNALDAVANIVNKSVGFVLL